MAIQHILIIKPSSLGDVATTLPLLCDLKRKFPEAHIDWLIHPAFAPLLEGHDALRTLIPFDRKKLAAWWYHPTAFRAFRNLLQQLRANQYDLVLDAQGLFRSGYLTRATRAPMRIGFAHAREFAPFAYTHRIKLPDRGQHMLAVDRMRALSGPLGIDLSPPHNPAEFRMPIHPEAAMRAQELSPHPHPIIIIPGARWSTKRWDLTRYAQLTTRLLEQGHPILLLGSPDEKPLCDQLAASITLPSSAALTNLAGQTTLAEMVALLARARLIIGNDSGPLHVAVALGRPILGLYGPTSESFVGPYGQLDNVLRHNVWCHPCRRKECDHHSCMKGLTVELTWNKTQSLLQKATP